MRNLGKYALFLGAILASLTYASSIAIVNPAGPAGLVGTDISANSYTATAASGNNGFAIATNGARVDFGAGASDYMSSDGTTITAANNFAVGNSLQVRNNTATTYASFGTAGTAYLYVTNAAKVFFDFSSLTATSNSGRIQAYLGTGTGVGFLPVVANKVSAVVGNVGAGEDDLMTYSLPANSLAGDGSSIRITAWGSGANNANAKTVKCYFGATALITTALTTGQADSWRFVGEVIRTGAATQVADGQLLQGGTTTLVDVENASPGETLSGAVTIKCTGTATNNDDIQQKGFIVEYL